MDGLVLLFVAFQAILIALVAAQAIARGRELERIAATVREEPEARDHLADPAGAVVALRGRAERLQFELRQVHQDSAYLADLIGAGIVHLDDDLRVDQANAGAHVFLGRPSGALVGRTAMEAFVDRRIEAIVTAAREHGAETGEITVREPDGPVLIVRARRSPIRGIWVVLEDVAELRRLQRIRSEFIDNLSHEMRTPLSAVALLAESLSRDAEAAGVALPPRMRDRISKIEVETGHLTQMVTELLDLSAIESGTGQLHVDDVDLARIAAASIDRLRLFADRNAVRLRLDAPDAHPLIRGDADRLGQVFVNLLHNAVKFSPNGGTVVIRIRTDGDQAMASVSDQGIGIPDTELSRIFERFYKVDRVRVRGGGTGLGLAIARHIVDAHGGRIWAESEEGVGSTFWLELPLAPTPTRRRPRRRPRDGRMGDSSSVNASGTRR